MSTTTAPTDLPVLEDDPFSQAVRDDPYAFHARLRDAGPVVRLPAHDVVALGRYADVHAALLDWPRFVSSRGAGLTDYARQPPWRPPSLLLEADPPAHTGVRDVMNAVMSPRTVRAMREAFRDRAEALADELVERGEFDAATDLAEVFPLEVFPDAVGLREQGRSNLLPYAALAFNSVGPENELLAAARAGAETATEWVEESCRREHLAPGGFGARLWEAADRGEITHEQAPMLVRSLLSAGVDTTVYGIGSAVHALATAPDQWALLHEDPGRTKFAFDEALRWSSPVQSFFRTTVAPVEVDGSVVPADTKVMLFVGSANRDPRHWGPDADRFDVGRRAAGHLAFGMGVHQCVGQPVARMEVELVLSALARRASRLELTAPPTPKPNNTLRGWSSVPVRVSA